MKLRHLFICAIAVCALAPLRSAAGTVYVSKSSVNPTAPYDTWDTAAHDLATAIGACSAPGEIIIDDGVFTNATALTIAKNITVKSRNGADKTTIFVNAGVTTTIASGGRLENLTLQGDYVSRGSRYFSLSGTISGCVIRRFRPNNIDMLYLSGGTITNSFITGNYVDSRDRMINSSGGKIIDTKIVGNSNNNPAYPTVLDLSGNGVVVRNCLIACNTNFSSYACVLDSRSRSATFENCTIVGNRIRGSATAAVLTVNSKVTFTNCIIHDNCNTSGACNFTGSTAGITYSATNDKIGGETEHNVISTADTFGEGYRLNPGLWIDAATALAWHEGAKDLAGTNRVMGAAADMGCYELAQGALKCAATPSIYVGLGAQDVAIGASAFGTNLVGLTYSYVVKDANGKVVYSAENITASAVTNHFEFGSYEMTLTVKNAAGETDTWTGKERFTINPDTVYVSHDSKPEAPYGSWATAAPDFATAFATCSDGMTVVIDDGIYTNTAAATLSSNIKVKSRNGADKTTIFTKSNITLFSLSHADARVSGLTFKTDGSSRTAAGIAVVEGMVYDCVIRNFSQSASGALSISGSKTFQVVSNVTITANYESAREGVICGAGSSGLLVNCKIVGNKHSNDEYGCIDLWSGTTTFRNCLLACNTNTSSGSSVIYVRGGTGVFENCTIVDNHTASSDSMPGILFHSDTRCTATLKNCILHDNSNRSGVLNYSADSRLSITYSATSPVYGDETKHNVLSTATIFGKDYMPNIGAWIDSGTALAWHDNGIDLAGNARVQGSAVDMGCYEAEPVPFSCSISVAAASRVGAGEMKMTATVLGAGSGDIDYKWTVTNRLDGTVITQTMKNNPDFTTDYPVGQYSVKLEVTNGGETVSDEVDNAFAVYPTVVKVNKNAKSDFPYDTDENAFTDISDATGFALDGMTVLVADGVYTNKANVVLNKEVMVKSEHGLEKTRAFSAGGSCPWQLRSAKAVVSGFTIYSDFVYRTRNAVVIPAGRLENCVVSNFYCGTTPVLSLTSTSSAGMVTNCIFVANKAQGRVYFCEMNAGAKICNTKIIGNWTDGSPYSSLLSMSGGAKVCNSLLADNSIGVVGGEGKTFGTVVAGSGVTLVNCTLVNNISWDTKAVTAVYGSATLKNCILWNNRTKAGETSCGGGVTCHYCLGPDATVSGTGCVVGDPKFRGGANRNRRYIPHLGSPAIDAADRTVLGDSREAVAAQADLDGNSRLQGFGLDMGCYEKRVSGLMLLVK